MKSTITFGLHTFLLFIILVTIPTCTETAAPPLGEAEATELTSPINAAEVTPLIELTTATTGRLPLRRQANGLLRARREITIKSLTTGLLTTAPLEGKFYPSGSLLAQTDARALQLAVEAREVARDEAAFRYRDLLLRMAASITGDSLTTTQRENLRIQSGLPAAEAALNEALFQLDQCWYTAPFGGIAADVKVQENQSVNPGEELCTLIDLNTLEAEFSLLEQEILSIDAKTAIYITPIAQPDLKLPATLDIINPKVDKGGLLRVRARLSALPKGVKLYPGMNVTIVLEGRSPTLVIIPKKAVVLRSGRSVVFTYDPASKRAQWKYVTVSHENDEQVGIAAGLTKGEQVIVSGNLTLDHDSEVALN